MEEAEVKTTREQAARRIQRRQRAKNADILQRSGVAEAINERYDVKIMPGSVAEAVLCANAALSSSAPEEEKKRSEAGIQAEQEVSTAADRAAAHDAR